MQTINKDMIQHIGNDAVREAQKKSLENGVQYFQLPDVTIAMEILLNKAN
jgi:hypothetical protein